MKRDKSTYDFVREELKAGDKYITTAHDIGYNEGWNEALEFICERLAGDPSILYVYKRYEDL